MQATYKHFGSPESRDRLWLCKLLIVFALGESFVNFYAPVIHLGSNIHPTPDGGTNIQDLRQGLQAMAAPPGSIFFEQALVLLKLPYEEPCVEQVEILNLAVRHESSTRPSECSHNILIARESLLLIDVPDILLLFP